MIIVLSSDQFYSPLLGVMMYSIVKYNPNCPIAFYILDDGIEEQQKKSIIDFISSSFVTIHFIDCSEVRSFFQTNVTCKVRSYAMYFRLFLTSLLPQEVDKVIYFDCDGLVIDKLADLWNTEIDNYHIAGVLDYDSLEFKRKVGMNKHALYMNSGMLLINLKKWREEKLKLKFIHFLKKHNGNVFHHDQGIINSQCTKKKIISPRYNLMSPLCVSNYAQLLKYNRVCEKEYYTMAELEEARKNPIFLHFVPFTVGRPWEKHNYHPYSSLYYEHQNLTPWKNQTFPSKFRGVSSVLKELYRHLPYPIFFSLTRFIINAKRLVFPSSFKDNV